jgi:hypothetical protein
MKKEMPSDIPSSFENVVISHYKELKADIGKIEKTTSHIETRLNMYEAVMPKENFREMADQHLLMNERIRQLEIKEATRQTQSEQAAQTSKQQSFTWIHAVVMLLLATLLSMGGNYLMSGGSEKVKELEKKLEQLKSEKIGG